MQLVVTFSPEAWLRGRLGRCRVVLRADAQTALEEIIDVVQSRPEADSSDEASERDLEAFDSITEILRSKGLL